MSTATAHQITEPRDPLVFVPSGLEQETAHQGAEPREGPVFVTDGLGPVRAHPPSSDCQRPDSSDYAYCVDIADAIGDLLALPVNIDVLQIGTEVLLAWDANRAGCQLDSEQAGEWRERLGLEMTDMLQTMDTDTRLAGLESIEWAHALGINKRELHWRLERAGQMRLPL